ncbi:MAG: DUF2007 domain-containing protein [Actinomycetota bacterium]
MRPEIVTIHTASDRIEAETIAALLRSHDIATMVAPDDAGGTDPALAFIQGVPVMVPAAQADEAHQVLGRERR